MKLYKTKEGILIEKEENSYLFKEQDWDTFINDDNLLEKMEGLIQILKKCRKIILIKI